MIVLVQPIRYLPLYTSHVYTPAEEGRGGEGREERVGEGGEGRG